MATSNVEPTLSVWPKLDAGILKKFTLIGKIVVVTGAARGLGWEILRSFCEAGAAGVSIIDILPDGEAAAKTLHDDFGIVATFYEADVRDHVAVDQAIDRIMQDHSRIDVLVCAAGVVDSFPAEDYPAEKFKRIMDTNLNGVFFSCQAVGKRMIQAGAGGSIVAIASAGGHVVAQPQKQSAYNASKAAVIHLCKCLAAEWATHKIRVNTISPGYMDTAFTAHIPAPLKDIWTGNTPQARMGDINELNGTALYLASDASTFTTGCDILVDGGITIL